MQSNLRNQATPGVEDAKRERARRGTVRRGDSAEAVATSAAMTPARPVAILGRRAACPRGAAHPCDVRGSLLMLLRTLPPAPPRRSAPSRRAARAAALAAWLLMLSATAAAQTDDAIELRDRLNALRGEPRTCGAQPRAAAPALRLDPALSRAADRAASQGRQAVQDAGYLPGRIEVLTLSGPRAASQVASLVRERHCDTLMNGALRDLGVQRSGSRWTLVFAQPALDPALGDWRAAGQRVLALVNEARRSARRCGADHYPAAPPVAWSDALAAAALVHSRDMARTQHFDHRGSDGSEVAQRVQQQGYAWQAVGENIAAGPGSAPQVVAGWLASPGHCANLMSAEFTQMGAAYVLAPEAPLAIYWTQVFATPRR
jgi:uncharacterized protein YkwD